jgi:RraA family protein
MNNQITQGKVGFCIGPDFKRPPQDLLDKLTLFSSPAVSDGLNKTGTMNYKIKPVWNGLKICGPAMTVKCCQADNLMLHKAIGMAKPGDILVVDTGDCMEYAIMGDLMASASAKMRIGGIVVDGCVRDVAELREKRSPIFAKGFVPAAGFKDGPGEINTTIVCGGVAVHPGDIILGDDNGVVVIPPHLIDQIIEGTEKKLAYEKKRIAEIEAGNVAKADIDETLRKKGVII